MRFTMGTPEALKQWVNSLIYGDEVEPFGYTHALSDAKNSISQIDAELTLYTSAQNNKHLDSLRIRKSRLVTDCDLIKEEIGLLTRLSESQEMKNVYDYLAQETTKNHVIDACKFVKAARQAHMDFSKIRPNKKEAAELQKEIAHTADKLAKLIDEFSSNEPYGPVEFHDVAALLLRTDNHDDDDHNVHMWQSQRPYLLGDIPEHREKNQPKIDITAPMNIVRVYVDTNDEIELNEDEQRRNYQQYAWNLAPSIPSLLRNLAAIAGSHQTSAYGVNEAATQARQNNSKTDYLRAFYYYLRINNVLPQTSTELSSNIIHAIAIIATTVLHDPEDDNEIMVSYDDVRKLMRSIK